MEFQPAGSWQLPEHEEAGEQGSAPFREAINFLRKERVNFFSEAMSGCFPAMIKMGVVITLAVSVTAALYAAKFSGMATLGGGLLTIALALWIVHERSQ